MKFGEPITCMHCGIHDAGPHVCRFCGEDPRRPKEPLAPLRTSDTLEVNIYGGPGTGKSTTGALVFGALKQRDHNVENAHEYAKDLTWEKHFDKLSFQPLVAAEQMWRIRRLLTQVSAVISDTSTLLGLIYGTEEGGVTPAFKTWLLDDYKRRNTLDIYLQRDPSRPYNPIGRNQTEEEALAVDSKIRDLLTENGIPHIILTVDKEGNSHVKEIVRLVEERI